MLRLGIVGAGTMGSMIATAVDRGEITADLVAVADLEQTRAESLASSCRRPPSVCSLPELCAAADLVVEAAGAGAVAGVLRESAARGKDVLILSVGGLIGQEEWIDRARSAGSTIYCPSGAIAGLDAVKAAARGQIVEARLTTRKPPAGLTGVAYLAERGIDVMKLEAPTVVFEGSAREACRAFPANINVSAALSLAGIGVDRTRVRIVADPTIERNIHEIEVTGDFGRIRTVTENVPSDNPRTSRLAALSAIALLKNLSAPLRMGT